MVLLIFLFIDKNRFTMKEKDIYIVPDDYTHAIPTAKYGMHLSKKLDSTAVLQLIENISPLIPVMTVGAMRGFPSPIEQGVLAKKVIPYVEKIDNATQHIWDRSRCEVAVGYPVNEVLQIASNKNPFLMIVEGSSELTFFNEWFGTSETTVAENTECPVLIVQPKTEWHPIENILYLIDIDDNKSENIEVLYRLTKSLDAHLQVGFISKKNKIDANERFFEMVIEIKELLKDKNASFYQIFGEKNSADVKLLVEVLSPDWIALEQKNKNFFQRIFDDYNTKRLILQSEIPVLVF
jgi:nucleotide-binding universal stress UspA family protein